jgi:hypothetical protein
MSYGKAFKKLINLYDEINKLSHFEKAHLYAELYQFPESHEFLLNDIENYKRELIIQRDARALKYLQLQLWNVSYYIDTNFMITSSTVYDSKHNSHSFTSETFRIAKLLLRDHETTQPIEKPFDHKYFDDIKNVIIHDINIESLVASVWNVITKSEHKVEMITRLKEELDDALGTCVIGHVCRLINALRGFGTLYETNLSNYEYDKAKLFNELNKKCDFIRIDTILDQIRVIINEKNDNTLDTCKMLKEYSHHEWMLVKLPTGNKVDYAS